MPKIAEVNAICAELGKDKFLYSPEITTDISGDGSRVTRVVVRLYPDKHDKEVYSQLDGGVFTDVVYMNIKEKYEILFEDNDQSMSFDLGTIDDSAFGFDFDSNNCVIGHCYIFLATIYNLIDVKRDRTPIIDTKGQI